MSDLTRAWEGSSGGVANLSAVSRRALPVLLVVAAGLVDSLGFHDAAFYLLVAAVPVAAISALEVFGELVEIPGGGAGETRARIEALLAIVGLVAIVVAAAVRGNATGDTVPALGVSALVACLVVSAAQVLILLAPTPAPASGERTPLRGSEPVG